MEKLFFSLSPGLGTGPIFLRWPPRSEARTKQVIFPSLHVPTLSLSPITIFVNIALSVLLFK